MNNTIAYLGPEGSFSQQAALRQQESLGTASVKLEAYPNIPSILHAVDKGTVAWGIVPAENSIEGSVNITLDILANELNLYIQREIVLEIKHQLISFAAELSEIRTVMSHPHALAQCRLFLEKYMPEAAVLETSSTSEAVRRLSPDRRDMAAIASWNSHQLYGVPIIRQDIGDYQQNQTRFWIVGKDPLHGDTTKTSLVLSMEKDRPGSLYETLGEFAKYNINLTRIESRPAKKELGNYIFFIDCEAGLENTGMVEVINNLANKTIMLKVLGSYDVIHG